MKKAFFKLNIESNQFFHLPPGIFFLTDSDILDNFQDLHIICQKRNLDYSQFFNLNDYSIAVERFNRKSNKITNGEIYLTRFLDFIELNSRCNDQETFFKMVKRQLGVIAFGEHQAKDPFITVLALVYIKNGKGVHEFLKSLNSKQLEYVRKNATNEPFTLLDILCLRSCRRQDISISSKDLISLLDLQANNDYLSIFAIASPDQLYSELLFLNIEQPTILTCFFQLICFERSKNYSEKNFSKMRKIYVKLMNMQAKNEIDKCLQAQADAIFDKGNAYKALDFRFSWIRSAYYKYNWFLGVN